MNDDNEIYDKHLLIQKFLAVCVTNVFPSAKISYEPLGDGEKVYPGQCIITLSDTTLSINNETPVTDEIPLSYSISLVDKLPPNVSESNISMLKLGLLYKQFTSVRNVEGVGYMPNVDNLSFQYFDPKDRLYEISGVFSTFISVKKGYADSL